MQGPPHGCSWCQGTLLLPLLCQNHRVDLRWFWGGLCRVWAPLWHQCPPQRGFSLTGLTTMSPRAPASLRWSEGEGFAARPALVVAKACASVLMVSGGRFWSAECEGGSPLWGSSLRQPGYPRSSSMESICLVLPRGRVSGSSWAVKQDQASSLVGYKYPGPPQDSEAASQFIWIKAW